MEQSLQDLIARLDQLSDGFAEVREGVRQTVLVADLASEMALTRARKVLEYLVRDVYQRRVKEPPGTRPLENLLDRLAKDGHFPLRLNAYANTIRMLGNVGTHNFGERISAGDVYQSLAQLMPILQWYFEVERPDSGMQLALPRDREPERPMLLDAYHDDHDAGIHGAAEWTLRAWNEDEAIQKADAELQQLKDRGSRRWLVNSQGQTLAVIEGPAAFMMGSPPSEPGRFDHETQHLERINGRFAIVTKEVSREQYERFVQANSKN
jgi:hypothetical protein